MTVHKKGIIHGYSERGVVNALFESLVAADDVALFRGFLQEMEHWNGNQLSLPEFDDYEVFIEASLSDFGEPDVLVFLKREDRDVGVYFIEAKMETFLHSSPPAESSPSGFYTKNASTILHELFLKVHFVDALQYPNGCLAGDLMDGVKGVYLNDAKETRKIGEDHMVLALARRLRRFVQAEGRPFFVSLTTDLDTGDSVKVLDLVAHIVNRNATTGSPIMDLFEQNLLLLSWTSIFEFASKHGSLRRVTHQLERNITKFEFPRIKFVSEVTDSANRTPLAALVNLIQRYAPHKKVAFSGRPDGSFTISVGGRALFTGKLLDGLDGNLLSLYPVKESVRGRPLDTCDDPLLNRMWPDTLLVKASALDMIISAGVFPGNQVWQCLVDVHLDSLLEDSKTSKGRAS